LDYENGIIEYDMEKGMGILVTASEIRQLIGIWTKVGSE